MATATGIRIMITPTTHKKTVSSKVLPSMSLGPSPEYADWWYVVSWKGIIWAGVIAAVAASMVAIFTALQFWSDGVRDQKAEERSKSIEVQLAAANERAAQANERAAEFDLARARIEARIAPRLITQAQQHDLTAKLSQFKDVRGTIIASPSTPESEWFARVLGAPLKEAGWDITILPGTATATILQPTGIVIKYPIDRHVTEHGFPNPGPAASLSDALNELAIFATALPGLVITPNTVEITISAK